MSDEAFVIIDVSDSGNWDSRYAGVAQAIPPKKRPTVLQGNRAHAEAECLRLQRAHPRGQFVLFTATYAAVLVEQPTHVTLGGVVVASERHARLASLGEEPIPF